MASATSNTAAKKARKMPAGVKRDLATARKTKPRKSAQPKPRVPFLPGSLNDQLSKLDVGESHAKCERFQLDANTFDTIQLLTQKFFKAQNSILSGGIAKVRANADHKTKRFKMERGNYMSASNDAMFAFLTVTRTE